jgi:hypothetical protein
MQFGSTELATPPNNARRPIRVGGGRTKMPPARAVRT